MSRRCVVIGAGVVGVTTALHMAERGFEVCLLEAATPGAGAGGTTFAHVNARYVGYWDYFELRAAGVAGTRLGRVVRPNQQVAGFQTEGDTVRAVILESGERIAADVVVCCCGRWTDAVLGLTGISLSVMTPDVPGSTAPGLIVVSSPVH